MERAEGETEYVSGTISSREKVIRGKFTFFRHF